MKTIGSYNTLDARRELFVDLFAGGGGASTGVEAAIGRHVDIAVNHDPEAISVHTANHPPKELYAAQGLTKDYRFECGQNGEPMTKTAQVRMCGNSVSPPAAEALVRANYSELAVGQEAA
jgi:site-specific DNA-cytosine methylase